MTRWICRRRTRPASEPPCAQVKGEEHDEMSVREIPAEQWRPFLEQFSRDHRAWLATVERVHAGGPGYVAAPERPLGAVVPEGDARRVVGIAIQFQPDSRAGEPLRIDAPARLRVDETKEGAARALEIEDARGDCTRILFRAAPPLEALDGLAPGEL
jgi:hypothetical protein